MEASSAVDGAGAGTDVCVWCGVDVREGKDHKFLAVLYSKKK